MEYKNKSNSAVWKHFLQEEKGQTGMCKCTNCKKILTLKGGSAKGLHMHLLSVHKINLTTGNYFRNQTR